jgi:hypothetical protein
MVLTPPYLNACIDFIAAASMLGWGRITNALSAENQLILLVISIIPASLSSRGRGRNVKLPDSLSGRG